MLRIVDRYVFKECAFATLAVILVLLVILLGNSLVRVLGSVVDGKLPSDALLPMLGVNLIHYLIILVPLGLYLGILLGMGRLYRDSEMAALYACGIGTLRLYRPVNSLAILVALLTAFLVFFLAPWAAGKQDELKHKARYRSEVAGLSSGQFNTTNGQTLFFESADNKRVMRNVFSYTANDGVPTVQLAETGFSLPAERSGSYVVFTDGRIYSGQPGQMDYRITEFSTYGVSLKERESPELALRISALPTSQLFVVRDPVHNAELHWRIAVPIACMILALLALPLSYTSPRKGRFSKLGVGILVYIVYSNLIGLGRVWLERELVAAWIGLWWIHVVFIVVVILLLKKQEKIRLIPNFNVSGKAA